MWCYGYLLILCDGMLTNKTVAQILQCCSHISHNEPSWIRNMFMSAHFCSKKKIFIVRWVSISVSQSLRTQRHSGVWLMSQFPPFRYFPNLSGSPKFMLAIEYYVHIWQVSPQFNSGDTCQKWMWCKKINRYLGMIENFVYGEFNERGFSTPHPGSLAF